MRARVVTVVVLAVLGFGIAGLVVPWVRADDDGGRDDSQIGPEVPTWLLARSGVSPEPGTPSSAFARLIEDRLRLRFAKQPDPETAWTLAHVLQLHIGQGLSLQGKSLWQDRGDAADSRVRPGIHYGVMAEILERGFDSAPLDHPRRAAIAQGLAKIALLRGDWAAMNRWLERIGQRPIPAAQRP